MPPPRSPRIDGRATLTTTASRVTTKKPRTAAPSASAVPAPRSALPSMTAAAAPILPVAGAGVARAAEDGGGATDPAGCGGDVVAQLFSHVLVVVRGGRGRKGFRPGGPAAGLEHSPLLAPADSPA